LLLLLLLLLGWISCRTVALWLKKTTHRHTHKQTQLNCLKFIEFLMFIYTCTFYYY
jgi:hypothetical protein